MCFFQTLQTNLAPGAPNLNPLCPTWTRAFEALFTNYGVLKVALLEILESMKVVEMNIP